MVRDGLLTVGLGCLAGGAVLIAAAAQPSAADAGIRGDQGEIRGRVWIDTNANGIQDGSDFGAIGVPVRLSGAGTGMTMTGTDGVYTFGELELGTYTVEVEPSAFEPTGQLFGKVPTLAQQGSDPGRDSDTGFSTVTLTQLVPVGDNIDLGYGDCAVCESGAVALSLKYTGASEVLVEVFDDTNTLLFDEAVTSADAINVMPRGGSSILGDSIRVVVNGEQNAVFDTGCACCRAGRALPPAPIDLDRLRRILEDLGRMPPAAATPDTDVDRNGVVDENDVLALLDVQRLSGMAAAVGPAFLMTEDFESGATVLTAAGRFAVRDDCARPRGRGVGPVGDGWAYNGTDRCSTRWADADDVVVDTLACPPIDLPAAEDIHGSATLRFAAAVNHRRSSGYYRARATVEINGVEVMHISPGRDYVWREYEVDLSPWAGQAIEIAWRWETNDHFFSGPSGFHVDNIEVMIEQGEDTSVCIGPGYQQGEILVVAGTSGGELLCDFTMCRDGVEGEGACCLGDGSCEIFPSAPECYGAGGFFQGPGVACADAHCAVRVGACCLAEDRCMMLIYEDCLLASGAFLGPATTCQTVDCSLASCCFPSGQCLVVSVDNCKQADGVAGELGSDCIDVDCGRKGACCLPRKADPGRDGGVVCRRKTMLQCMRAGGEFLGAGTRCQSVECPEVGACCMQWTALGKGDDACVIATPGECHDIGGVYQGDGTRCTAFTCQPLGACCLCDDTCIDTTEAGCNAAGGVPRPGLGCVEVASGLVCLPFGSCCMPDACVDEITEADCLAMSACARWTECGSCLGCTITPEAGACCIQNICMDSTMTTCAVMNGEFQGEGTCCATAECVTR